MIDLYGRSAETFRLKHGIRRGERFGRLPSAITHRRDCIGNSAPGNGFLIFFPDINAGFRLYCAFGIVFTGNRLILPVDLLDILFRHIVDKAFASVPVKAADLSDLICADEQIDPEAEKRKDDDVREVIRQIIDHGYASRQKRNRMGNQKNQTERSISQDPVSRAFLHRFAESNPVDDDFEHHAEHKACQPASERRPAQKP